MRLDIYRQIKSTVILSLCIKYSLRDLLHDANYRTAAAKVRYASCKENDVRAPSSIITPNKLWIPLLIHILDGN